MRNFLHSVKHTQSDISYDAEQFKADLRDSEVEILDADLFYDCSCKNQQSGKAVIAILLEHRQK